MTSTSRLTVLFSLWISGSDVQGTWLGSLERRRVRPNSPLRFRDLEGGVAGRNERMGVVSSPTDSRGQLVFTYFSPIIHPFNISFLATSLNEIAFSDQTFDTHTKNSRRLATGVRKRRLQSEPGLRLCHPQPRSATTSFKLSHKPSR